jgi:catechol 2,3-dioxygenase-like lactoylglutathione lyase family enzyme
MTADDQTDLGNGARLVSLTVADDATAWEAAGFTVVDSTVTIDGTAIHLTGRAEDRAHRGIRNITVSGLAAPAGDGTIDGLNTTFVDDTNGSAPHGGGEHPPAHPNGTTGIDHVVIITPDLDRTIAAFAGVGLGVRRIRETESYGAPMRQAFLRLGPTIVEVVGGHEGTGQSADEAPADCFGLALDVADLDATGALLGDGMGAIKPAVQEGRRIATIRHKNFGMSVATALMDDGA